MPVRAARAGLRHAGKRGVGTDDREDLRNLILDVEARSIEHHGPIRHPKRTVGPGAVALVAPLQLGAHVLERDRNPAALELPLAPSCPGVAVGVEVELYLRIG